MRIAISRAIAIKAAKIQQLIRFPLHQWASVRASIQMHPIVPTNRKMKAKLKMTFDRIIA
jgi:hypothetical protein